MTEKEDIEVIDLDSSSVLAALASGFITYCYKPNKIFLKCKAEHLGDPEKCVNQALDLRKCGFKL